MYCTPPTYTVPPLALLSIPQQSALDNTEWLEEQKELLDTTFNNFHVGAHVINVSQGPAVTRFEVRPDPGVKVNKITNLSDDIKLSLRKIFVLKHRFQGRVRLELRFQIKKVSQYFFAKF